jgi:hypothetical protein
MKARRRLSLGILMGVLLLQSAFGGTKRDPFLKVDLNEFPKYRRVWSAKLEVTPFDCGRFVSLPAFEPESSVSVYSYQRKDGTTVYRVAYIEAENNIWQASDMVRNRKEAMAVKTRRIDADIPESTALLLRKVWSTLLPGDHPTRSTTPRDVIPIDTPIFEWSLQRLHGPSLRVQANFYVALTKATDLRKLFADLSGVTLTAYCKAEPSKRPAIASRIDREAKALLREKRLE